MKNLKRYFCVFLIILMVLGCSFISDAGEVNNYEEVSSNAENHDIEEVDEVVLDDEILELDEEDDNESDELNNKSEEKNTQKDNNAEDNVVENETGIEKEQLNKKDEVTIIEDEVTESSDEDDTVTIQATETKPGITYRTHVQNVGWQSWKNDGELSGTSGQSLRLEGIYIKLQNAGDIKLRYQTHVQDVGWQGWKNNGEFSGTSGKGKRLEAIKIELSNTDKYSVKYRVHVQNIGWQEWKYDGELAGTEGESLRLEAIEIQIVSKVAPRPHVMYSTHVQYVGWQGYKSDGGTAGTSGQSLRLEAIKIKTENLPKGVNIKYQTHIQNIGWQGWKSNNQLSGTEGQGLRLEGIKIKLENTSEYSIRYRVHVENIGWQAWCYDGETAGTSGESKRLEAIQIQIVPKVTLNKIGIAVDTPKGTVYNKVQNISGWVMSSMHNVSIKIFIDNVEIDTSSLSRTVRQDVINYEKGYGDESIYNQKPGFVLSIDFGAYSLGTHNIKAQAILNNKVVREVSHNFNIEREIVAEKGVYGVSGLGAIGDPRGCSLQYYKYGNGPNVLFATFAIHGWEDLWARDGWELVGIADELYKTLVNLTDYSIHDKWTIYIFPGVNMDGLQYGYTNNGPGRTTLTGVRGSGIDLNRCWQTGSSFSVYTSSRYYSGTEAFQAYESRYLRDFLLNHKSASGQTVLVDCHGWLQQLIGDSTVCSYYKGKFPESNASTVGRYGDGYLIGWARLSLGNSNRPAKSALIELPSGVSNHQTVMNQNIYGRYIQATLNMLRDMN